MHCPAFTRQLPSHPPLLWITMWVTRLIGPLSRTIAGCKLHCPKFHQRISLEDQSLARLLRLYDGTIGGCGQCWRACGCPDPHEHWLCT
jgi:hypothetical protein